MVSGDGIPLDAPLYRLPAGHGAQYWGCRAVLASFTLAGPVDDLLPRGLRVPDTAVGAVLVADYGASTLGAYREFVSFVAAVDDEGTEGLYIPYIYVTNDAALAAGREVLGAPKKLADISVDVGAAAVQGVLARPAGQVLAQVTMAPVERLSPELLRATIAPDTPFWSLRHLPGPPGGVTVTELVRWRAELALHRDAFGEELLFAGPGSVTYPTVSAVDPVHRLQVDTDIATVLLQFDMRLQPSGVVWSQTVIEAAAGDTSAAPRTSAEATGSR